MVGTASVARHHSEPRQPSVGGFFPSRRSVADWRGFFPVLLALPLAAAAQTTDLPPVATPAAAVTFPEIMGALAALIIVARLIVKLTPTPKDDTIMEKIVDGLKHLGLVIKCAILCAVIGLTGCVSVSGTRTAPDGTKLAIATHRFLWASQNIDFTTTDITGLTVGLKVGASSADASAITALGNIAAQAVAAAAAKP